MEMRDSNSDEEETIETATQALAWNDGPVTTDYGEGPLPTARATPFLLPGQLYGTFGI